MAAGVVYICLWPSLAPVLKPRPELILPGIEQYSVLRQFTDSCTICFLEAMSCTGTCVLVRHQRAVLRHLDFAGAAVPLQPRLQYSLMDLLIWCFAATVLVMLVRGVRSAGTSLLRTVSTEVLFLVVGLLILLGGMWSCLIGGRPHLRVLFFGLVASWLALPVAHVGPAEENVEFLWQYLMGACHVGVPAIIVLVSFLIVRSDGYRLFPVESDGSLSRL